MGCTISNAARYLFYKIIKKNNTVIVRDIYLFSNKKKSNLFESLCSAKLRSIICPWCQWRNKFSVYINIQKNKVKILKTQQNCISNIWFLE